MKNPEITWEEGVSPVVGVMLMLVVTIIIATVVSAFAGGLVEEQEQTPSAIIDVTIKNSGDWKNSYVLFDVKSVEEPFSSADIKIVTAWTNSSGTVGGNITLKGLNAPNTCYNDIRYHAPVGFGPTLSDWEASAPFSTEQYFGNFTISGGTTMKASAYGDFSDSVGYGVETPYTYRGDGTDAMQAILGTNWNSLRAGDTVKVMILHIPSGKMIYNREISVVG